MSRPRLIGILDLGFGNLKSLSNAIYQNGFDPVLVKDGSIINDFSHFVIPGVGNFAAAVSAIERKQLRSHFKKFVDSGRPLMGLCLGMQLLATVGTEGGASRGLGFIPGQVTIITPGKDLRIPHVGWNNVKLRHLHPVLEGLKPNCDFYFVHSYEMICDFDEDLIAVTDYGSAIAAVVGRKNVIGFQFHPEKSQLNGLVLISNFCNWDGKC